MRLVYKKASFWCNGVLSGELSNTFLKFKAMKEITLKGLCRETSKKSAVNAMRREGRVPCVLYGQGVESVLFSVDAKELKSVTHTPNSYIINLDIEGKSYKAVLHGIQFHPVSDETLHVDFLVVSDAKPVCIEVPIIITGNSEGVRQGGKLMVSARKLRISAPIDKLPDNVEVDITSLQLGKTITAGELSYDGIQIVTPKATIICAVKMTRAALGAAAAAAAAKK